MSNTFRQFQRLTASDLNRAIAEAGAQAGAIAGTAAAAEAVTEAEAAQAAAEAAQTAAEAAQTAAETAETGAETALTAAEAAVTAALGPVETSGVGGTDTAYTATSSHATATGRSFWFRPNATNGGSSTLSINGGTARSLRTETGTVLTAGQLRSGVEYLIKFDGTVFRVLGLRLAQRFQSRVNLIGSTATLDFYNVDADAFPRGRLSCDSNGRWLISSGGDGTAVASSAVEIQADGDVRFFARALNSNSSEFFHVDNPPDFDWNDVGEIMQTVAGPGDENLITPLTSSGTVPVQPTGADLKSRGWANVNNGWWDFDGLPKHADYGIGVGSAKTINLYTGSATNWVGRTSNVVQVTGPAIIRASTLQELGDMMVSSATGATLTDVGSPTIPVYGRTWVIGGQSWFKRLAKGGRSAIANTYRTLGDANPATRIIDGAVGASGLWVGTEGDEGEEGEETPDPANAYWDIVNDLPGPNAIIMRDAILAWLTANPTQPFPEAVLWQYGLPDLGLIATTGDYTQASWTQGQTDLQAWLDAELSTALATTVELNHFICPLPARKLGVWNENVWYALRRAQLDVITTAPRTFRGPDAYDSVRMWNDGHHGFLMQARVAARMPLYVRNALHGGTHYTGPEITDTHEISSSEYWVRIVRGQVSPGVYATLTRPANPAGFGLLPAGSHYIETRVDVARYSWTTDTNPDDPLETDDILRIFPRTPASGLRPVFMYGSGYETSQPSRLIRDLRTFLPLKIR